MKRSIIPVSVNQGKVATATRENLLAALSQDGQYIVTIEKQRKKRSPDQNEFYWHVFIPCEAECFKQFWGEDYSKQEIHDFNKTHIWGEERLVGDEVVKMPCTSTKYDTLEWEQRLDIARTWFKNAFDYDIPYPSQQLDIHYEVG